MFAHAERMQRPGEDFECPALKSPSYSVKTRVSHRLWLTIGLARLVSQQAPCDTFVSVTCLLNSLFGLQVCLASYIDVGNMKSNCYNNKPYKIYNLETA